MALVLDGSAGVTFPVVAGGTSAVQASSGKVLQVVQSVTLTNTSTTSATPVTTGISASITPSSNTSKVLVFIDTQVVTNTTGNGIGILLYRGGSVVKNSAIDSGTSYYTQYAYTARNWMQQSITYLDNPATTSSTTYTIYFASYTSGSTVQIGGGSSPNYYPTTITLMEIAA